VSQSHKVDSYEEEIEAFSRRMLPSESQMLQRAILDYEVIEGSVAGLGVSNDGAGAAVD
jgi:hypothetical protein